MTNEEFQTLVIEKLTTMENKLSSVENKLSNMDNKLSSVENKLDSLKVQFQEHEFQDANRHIETIGEIESLKKDLTIVEAVSGKNMADIALLKAIK